MVFPNETGSPTNVINKIGKYHIIAINAEIGYTLYEIKRVILLFGENKDFLCATFSRGVYLDRHTIKFCDDPFFIVNNNLVGRIPAIVSNTVSNCHERTGCG